MARTDQLESRRSDAGAHNLTETNRARASSDSGNSLRTNIGIGVVALVFLLGCLAVALGGNDPADPESTQLRTSAVAAPGAPDAPAATGETAQANPAETSDAEETPVATDEAPVVEEADSAEVPVVTDTPVVAEAADSAEAPVVTDAPVVAEEVNPEPDLEQEPESTPESEPTPDAPLVDSPPPPAGAPRDYAVLVGDTIFLRGVVPSAAHERQVVSSLENVFGAGNVVSEYDIDAEVPVDFDGSAPMYFEHALLFPSGSTSVPENFYSHLAPAPALLQLVPDAVITISGHTDSTGNADINQELSQARVDAIREWMISQGGDADRIIALGKGDSEPVADNATEAGRTQNRRVEFHIEGLNIAS